MLKHTYASGYQTSKIPNFSYLLPLWLANEMKVIKTVMNRDLKRQYIMWKLLRFEGIWNTITDGLTQASQSNDFECDVDRYQLRNNIWKKDFRVQKKPDFSYFFFIKASVFSKVLFIQGGVHFRFILEVFWKIYWWGGW